MFIHYFSDTVLLLLKSKFKDKKSFTLIELSIVIVIISIVLTIVLVSRALIDYAKAMKIQEEARMINISIKLFKDQYDCMPGDCTASQIPNLVSSGLNTLCVTNTAMTLGYNVTPLGTGNIETVVKRTCLMYELNLNGSPFFNTIAPTYNVLTDSIAGKNIPYAKFSSKAAWDIRLDTPPGPGNMGSNSSPFIPYTGSDTNSAGFSSPFEFSWFNTTSFSSKNYLLLRNANTIVGATGDMSAFGSIVNSNLKYSISASLARKVDIKFDDGLPYTGNIMSGVTVAHFIGILNGSLPDGSACTTFSNSQANSLNATAWPIDSVTLKSILANNYISSNAVNKGCLTGFLIDI